jgi:hypothetical protein
MKKSRGVKRLKTELRKVKGGMETQDLNTIIVLLEALVTDLKKQY